jgi:gas vesicle protein
MNSFVSFILGAIVGAAVALLYAPQSGEELRANLREEVQVERQRLQAQYEKSMKDLQERIDKIQVDVQSLLREVEEQEEEAAETA